MIATDLLFFSIIFEVGNIMWGGLYNDVNIHFWGHSGVFALTTPHFTRAATRCFIGLKTTMPSKVNINSLWSMLNLHSNFLKTWIIVICKINMFNISIDIEMLRWGRLVLHAGCVGWAAGVAVYVLNINMESPWSQGSFMYVLVISSFCIVNRFLTGWWDLYLFYCSR